MPQNKNAIIRCRYLDELLSDTHHYYSVAELTDCVNRRLETEGLPPVTIRCVEKDIRFLEGAPFYADIRRFTADGKHVVQYADGVGSVFTKTLTADERHLLREALQTLGQFDGLDNFEWLESLKSRLQVERHPSVIEFSRNPLYMADNRFLGLLFTAIANEQVVELHYHTFQSPEVKTILFHPYLLKEYNSRWYVIGGFDPTGFILNFALDRIDDVVPRPALPYLKPADDFRERFSDIVGVTLYADREPQDIYLWVSDASFPYMVTKPVHESQRRVTGEKEAEVRSETECPAGGRIIALKCITNRELLQCLFSYMDDVVVLSPPSLREEMDSYLKNMCSRYYINRCLCKETHVD